MKFIRTTLLFVALFAVQNCFSQTIAKNTSETAPAANLTSVEKLNSMPEYIGGNEALSTYMKNNLQYPENGVRKGHQ